MDITEKDIGIFKDLISGLPKYRRDFKDKANRRTKIRTVRPSDIGQVIAIAYRIWTAPPYEHNKGSLKRSRIKNQIKRSLKRANPIMLVAEQGGNTIAFIWGFDLYERKYPQLRNYLLNGPLKHVGYINELGVDTDFQRMGIAGALLDDYKRIAKEQGVDDLLLDTLNPAAKRLYIHKKHYVPVIDPKTKRRLYDRIKGEGIYQFLHLQIK